MKQVKTARGNVIDMNALFEENETSTAIGNVPMNARGDRLDKKGNVVATVQAMDKEQKKKQEEAKQASIRTSKPKVESVITRRLRKRRNGTKYIEVTDSATKEKVVYDVVESDNALPYIEISHNNGSTVAKSALQREDGSLYFEFENKDGSFEVLEL